MKVLRRGERTMRGHGMRLWAAVLLMVGVGLICTSCHKEAGTVSQMETGKKGGSAMRLASTAFTEGGMIPARYTGDGEDVSPPLAWSDTPAGTKSFALICDDPDAPRGTWVHWVVFNIPGSVNSLAEDVPPDKTLASGGQHGISDFRKLGYGGPAPPSGTHRYYFKLYALDTMLDLQPGATKAQLLDAMKGHILAEAQLMGKYARK